MVDLKEKREAKDMTQEGLANAIGLTRQNISAIEVGKIKPSVQTAKAIAEILEFEWQNFFDD